MVQETMSTPIPTYSGACISNVVGAIAISLAKNRDGDRWPSPDRIYSKLDSSASEMDLDASDWFPKAIQSANQTVLFVVDGLGSHQLERYAKDLPNFSRLLGTTISSVAPTTTATALTSIASGLSPIQHGIVGYRMRLEPGIILNSLTWTGRNAPEGFSPDPRTVVTNEPFFGLDASIVSKSAYANTGFTRAYLGDSKSIGFRFPSTMIAEVGGLLAEGAPFVYCYYEGLDSVAHEYGFGGYYEAELRVVDYFLGLLIDLLPSGASLVLTADHGQVEVVGPPIVLDSGIDKYVTQMSGEGRFRWLHLQPGSLQRCQEKASELYGDLAWVLTKQEVIESGLFGHFDSSRASVLGRLGDLALVSREPVAFYDPTDAGPMELICRHGSLTKEEMDVPLIGLLAT
ncbi:MULTISPECIES: alkaline phosphatase family protein [Acidithrix]|uniref:Type I phosphodiesterase / nucleotide pyrophosphatase n=1 Tax=Acidithrix ferrooxidans TaxID=1280514 RepID=A0A0D8HMC6_9ACTN|nr:MULTISPECIES: alkaline phosphatase family protein [Acidithrix]KJF19083.1 type I phosphodiesterase / nucleotide pyrophosphatase [Acidithrix ferrooxidans]CAG4901755.1 unnamed protein product [Acidithrix sp. C25]